MKKILESISLFALVMLALGLAFTLGYYARAITVEGVMPTWPPGQTNTHPLLNQIQVLLQQRYIGELPDESKLEYGAARGYVEAVGDPYTVFVEPQSHELETQSLQGEYGGVGMTLNKNEAGDMVLSPYPDSPAAKAGILEGDILLAVDSTPLTQTMTLDAVVALVRGPVNTQVTLRVRHTTGDELTATITRQTFNIPSVLWKMVDGQPTIGLIAVSRFSDKTPAEIKQAADELRQKGATRYILDLRNNGGGILESGVQTAGLFLDGGVVMYESQKNAPEKTYTVPANTGPLTTAPLVVLVNQYTASAAEIVAGALLDRERAPLIGQKTYGKGSVQILFDMPGGASLHITAYHWYTPAHRLLDKNGLPPTIAVEPSTNGTDAELARAIEYLNQTK